MIHTNSNENSEMISNQVVKKENHFVIGIGASAGGLEAIHELFDYLPNHSAFSYVIVQHLSPDYKSLMAELLTKHTQMKVSEASEGELLKPNSVYVIPTKKTLTLKHGKLRLADKVPMTVPNNAIDLFFESLAEDKGSNSIGIILSGTGTDGTKGIRAIKRAGGLVIVQDPATSKFDGMPNSAISSGQVDLILPPELMGEEIINYVTHGSVPRSALDLLEKEDEALLEEILYLIKENTTLDFTAYKRHTITRRIFKRMAHQNVSKLETYLSHLYNNPKEIAKLGQEFLIGVTRFFRDPEAFAIIAKQIIPAIFANKSKNEAIKVWVAACSTGEEAYSLAILFQEFLGNVEEEINIKIFATDIDLEAVEYAAKGTFPTQTEKDIPEEYLRKYFTKENDKLIVNPNIRKMVIFAHHSIIKDPPFSKLDLVSCRNLLIYMNPYLQNKLLSTLHFSLNKGGFLFLGSSENIGLLKGAVSDVSQKWNIYQIQNPSTPFALQPSESENIIRSKKEMPSHLAKSSKSHLQTVMSEVFIETVLEEFGYAGIYIDEEYNILQAVGDYKKFLELPEMKFQLNILKMVPHELSLILSVALRKAMKGNQKITTRNVKIKGKKTVRTVHLVVKPCFSASTKSYQKFLFILLTEDRPVKLDPKEEVYLDDLMKNERVQDLEQELKETRENLNNTVEELETSNEELQSTNEELLSSNEELQSTNEELQSLNEELHTINAEHQLKIKELIELNDDFHNYFRSTDIGQIFIDKNLLIRKYTPPAVNQINIIPSDIGRPISHFSFNVKDENLVEDIHHVIRTSQNLEKEIQNISGNTYLMRITPYVRQDKTTDGVVVTFVNITDLKYLNNLVSGVLNSSLNCIMALEAVKDDDGTIIDFRWMLANKATEKILKKSSDQLPKKLLSQILPEFKQDGFISKFARIVETGGVLHEEYLYKHEDGHSWFELVAARIDNGIALTVVDISEKKLAAEKIINAYENLKKAEGNLKRLNSDLEKRVEERTKEVSQSEERFRLVALATNDTVWDWNLVDNKLWWNEAFKTTYGYDQFRIEPGVDSWFNRIHVDDKERVIDGINKIINSGQDQWSDEYRFLKADGEYAFVYNRGYVLHNENNMPYRMLGSMVDFTNMKKVQDELKSSNKNLIKINNDLDNFVYTASHDLKSPIANLQSLIYHLKSKFAQKRDADEQKLLEMIELSIVKLNETIKALTEITKVQKDQQINIEKLAFKNILEDVKIDLNGMIEDTNCTFITDFKVEHLFFAKINLRSIFYNLLSNAIKYKSPERDPVIKISTERTGKYIRLSIQDNGLGLNESQLTKLFTMFRRFHTHVDGTGIGLYIVKRIIENKEGKIEVESEKDVGTRFNIYFLDEKKKENS